jgi:hypothetical protein
MMLRQRQVMMGSTASAAVSSKVLLIIGVCMLMLNCALPRALTVQRDRLFVNLTCGVEHFGRALVVEGRQDASDDAPT